MRTFKQWLEYQELELISTPEPKPNTLTSVLEKIGRSLINALTKGDEPRIWHSEDRFRQLSWHIYNPKNGESVQLASEAEVQVWLEERYYRRFTPQVNSEGLNASLGIWTFPRY